MTTPRDQQPAFVVRPAGRQDLEALGRLGASLIRQHHAFDAARFMAPPAEPEAGYAWFLGTQLADPDTVLLVAADPGGAIIGYVYAGLEPQSWKELRGPAGFIHDVVVADESRGMGAGAALVECASAWLKAHGAPRVILWTAHLNAPAQRLFTRLGFRPTMVEMTREL